MSKKTWVQKMDEIIERKKAKGMTGMKIFAMPSSIDDGEPSEEQIEAMAEAFCMIEKLRDEGVFNKTTSKTL